MGIFNLNNKEIAIDLGTTSIIISVKGKGIVIREPNIISIDKETQNVLAIGNEAKAMIGKNPENIEVIQPVKNGVISDCDVLELLLKMLMKKLLNRYNIRNPKVVVGIPSGITEVEERAVQEVIIQSGAREVYFIEEPLAAAIGSGLDISVPNGNIIVDIGGGTTEVAVISLGGIVVSNSIKVAGDKLDEDIINYVKREYNVLIGKPTAERIKIEIGCALPLSKVETLDVKGRDLFTGLPRTIKLDSTQVQSAIHESIMEIVECVKSTLEKTPPELLSDLAEKGIWLTGGGALLRNFPELLSHITKLQVYVSEIALESVVNGAEKSLENISKLKNIMINKRKLK